MMWRIFAVFVVCLFLTIGCDINKKSYDEGYQAGLAGIQPSDCPYGEGGGCSDSRATPWRKGCIEGYKKKNGGSK